MMRRIFTGFFGVLVTSALLAGLVTVIAVIGVVPYIALQLKAVAASLEVLVEVVCTRGQKHGPECRY
jgi:Na+/proline symporter